MVVKTHQVPVLPPRLLGDRTRLAQVVGNLLQNANKFTDVGGSVRVHLRAEVDDWVELSVHDTGIGMETAMLACLFEPFSQADRSLDRSRGGLGLGLALVKGLAELHGGHVAAASAGLGHGSEFTLRLPLSRQTGSAGPATSHNAFGQRSLRILLIEDNQDSADSLRLLLELYGHRVAVAYTGAAGVNLAREFRPQIVLCDIGLPGGMDGHAVARTLRADPELTTVPLIALSGYGQEEDQQRSRQSGFDWHLTKPCDPLNLLQILEKFPGPCSSSLGQK